MFGDSKNAFLLCGDVLGAVQSCATILAGQSAVLVKPANKQVETVIQTEANKKIDCV